MYCKHCGSSIDNNAAVCVHCGVPKGQGMNYCANCGGQVQPGAAVCMSCGCALNAGVNKVAMPGAKSKMAAGLLGIFLGCWGVHNFYLGYIGKAIAQLSLTIIGILTSCFYIGTLFIIGASIWGLVEGILILTGSINTDGKGNLLGD